MGLPHIAILPSPGMGHLIPLVELAKRLVATNNSLAITFMVPTDGPPSKITTSLLNSLPKTINHIFLTPDSFPDVPLDAKIETRISLTVLRSLPLLRQALRPIAKANTLVALVVDLFGTDAFDVALEFNASPYIFYPTTLMCLSLFFHLPKLDETVSCEYRDHPEPIELPGCVPLHGGELLDPLQDRKNDTYKWLLHHSKRYKLAHGIMVNSFEDIEGRALKALQLGQVGGNCLPPVYPVGPLVNIGGSISEGDEKCLTWLDNQPRGSVLFISFGSGGTLSLDQMIELAFGLEKSEQRFLWVVRKPNGVADSSFFTTQTHNLDEFNYLPNGFLGRTKERGFVIDSWAPQVEILSHDSTGGFLTHCGWNSTLESVVNGVPLIAWPLYAEQKMNAIMLTEDIKVGLTVKARETNGVIGRDEIARVVRSLMEGEDGKKVRHRMKELKDAAAVVVGENGSSTKGLTAVARKWVTTAREQVGVE